MVESGMGVFLNVFGVRDGSEFVVAAGNWNQAGEFEAVTSIDVTEGVTEKAVAALIGHVEKHGNWAESSSLHFGEIAERWQALVSRASEVWNER